MLMQCTLSKISPKNRGKNLLKFENFKFLKGFT